MDQPCGNKKSLSVIIPTYRRADLLEEFLPSVITALKNCEGNCELLVVDDCSPDDSFPAAKKFLGDMPEMKLLRTPQNGGFAATCNYGAAHAGGELLFFLNNDVRLSPDYFTGFQKYFSDTAVFALSPCGYDYHTEEQIDGIKTCGWKRGFMRFTGNLLNDRLKPDPGKPFLSFSVQGAYFFVDAKKFRALGGFDEIYSPYIMEETDLAYRALKRGWRILYAPEFKAWHKVGSSINSKVSAKAAFLSERNRLIFTWKNIADRRMLASHLFFLFLRLLSLKPVTWKAFVAALKMLPRIKAARIPEQQTAFTDRQLLEFYSAYFSKIA
jgi:GT2 family glycosyltransferase